MTFHQSYAYEDFVEGIRPVAENGAVTYEVRPGVLKRLCDRARRSPEKRFALFIDEINRGNVARVFGELITLVETDKRIRTDASGDRAASCKGLEVTLPYSGERFGVPANVDVIGTMNTADRSIALLDSALRRRFRFEELTPKPELLESIDDGEGNAIDLRQLLQAMNARLSRLLHSDQTLGHSYFYHVKSFDELRRVFAREIARYSERTANLNAIRGRIELTEHLRTNAFDRSHLLCCFDERSIDNPYNQALKAVLRILLGLALSPRTRAMVAAFLHRFDEVTDRRVRARDIESLRLDRTIRHWEPVFAQARWLLSGLYPDVRTGHASGSALLFNMEKLFEAVLGLRIRHACQLHGGVAKGGALVLPLS